MYHALSHEGAGPSAAARLVRGPLADLSAEARALVERALACAEQAQATIARQQARIAQLEALTATDELTGLLNRRGFMGALHRALANARRHGETGLLVAIDLDGFKPVNDTHGHAAGDIVLRHVAGFLGARVRTTDYLARLGGDEFAILMVNAQLGPARQRALAIKRQLDAAQVSLGTVAIGLRASFGIAPYDRQSSAEQVMHMADMAMYHDKRRRNAPRPIAAAE